MSNALTAPRPVLARGVFFETASAAHADPISPLIENRGGEVFHHFEPATSHVAPIDLQQKGLGIAAGCWA